MKKKLCVLLLGLCLISITACENKTTSGTSGPIPTATSKENVPETRSTKADKDNAVNNSEQETELDKLDETVSTDMKESGNGSSADEELVDGMRPEFKEAMDSYEAYYDTYCDILKKYTENPSDMELLSDYTDMLTKSVEMTEKFEAWEDDMNDTELKYYLDVNNRVTKKLLEVSE